MTGGINAGAAREAGFSPRRLQRVLDYLDALRGAGELPHYAISVERRGTTVLEAFSGRTRLDGGAAVGPDTVFRIFSMTKPITAVAAMSIYEEGAFQLDAPISRFLPEFCDQRVYEGRGISDSECSPADRPVTIRDLLTHTSGITSHRNTGYLETCYAQQNLRSVDSPIPLAEAAARIGRLPLCFQPGRRWKYGLSTDVLGRVLEVVTGQPLDEILHNRVFAPLGMKNTGFFVQGGDPSALAENYQLDAQRRARPFADALSGQFLERPVYMSGGGGLVSTLDNYKKFVSVLRGQVDWEEADIISPKTLRLMTANQLPGDLAAMGQPSFMETTTEGIGFGFNLSVLIDPIEAKIIGTPGEFGWGGLASTFFFVDPAESLSFLFLTQVAPSNTLPVRRPLRTLLYQAMMETAAG